jgi:hypothetical protein
MNSLKAFLRKLIGRVDKLRTGRDALFIVFGFFLTILLPAINTLVNPATWSNPQALGILRTPYF